MEQGGTDTSKLKLRYYSDNYRGVDAAYPIKKGDVIITVPNHLVITH